MLLDLRIHKYDKDIAPFIKNGIIIDACVIETLIDGFIEIRITKKKQEKIPDFDSVLKFLDLIKVNNRWSNFFVTPHILTEVFRRFRDKEYQKGGKYKEILEEVMPLIKSLGEENAKKENILNHIDHKNPAIEMGDISIFVVADDLTGNQNKKVAVLSADFGVTTRFTDNPNVLSMNYKDIMLNLT